MQDAIGGGMTHELLLMLQDIRLSAPDILTEVMLLLSSPLIYLAIPVGIGAVIYWCVSKKDGERIMLNVFFAYFTANVLKDVIKNPRPWLTDDRIVPETRALDDAPGYSTPSGHTTESASGYLSLAWFFRNRAIALALMLLTVGVMFSRLYLGVHTVYDLAAGLLLAVAIITVNGVLLRISYSDDGLYNRIGVLYLLFFIIVGTLWTFVSGDYGRFFSVGGVVLGALIGRLIEHDLIGFDTDGVTVRRAIVRIIAGGAVSLMMFGVPYLLLDGPLATAMGGFFGSLGVFAVAPLLFNSKSNY